MDGDRVVDAAGVAAGQHAPRRARRRDGRRRTPGGRAAAGRPASAPGRRAGRRRTGRRPPGRRARRAGARAPGPGRRLERGQIGGVASAVGQADVERPGRLDLGIVGLLVHRQREDARGRRRRSAAVPLPWWTSRSTTAARPARRSREHPADRHRHVVEHAEALAVAGEGVVEAAADVRGDAVVDRRGPGGRR